MSYDGTGTKKILYICTTHTVQDVLAYAYMIADRHATQAYMSYICVPISSTGTCTLSYLVPGTCSRLLLSTFGFESEYLTLHYCPEQPLFK